jgi:hypothetical protein
MRIRQELAEEKARAEAGAEETPVPAKRRRGRPPGSKEDREHIAAYLKDFQLELGDEAPLSTSITRALNIFTAAGIRLDQWGDCLYQARSITKERSGSSRQ